jgi:hypothetical protein
LSALPLIASQIPLGLMSHTPFASSSSFSQSGINRWYIWCIRHNQLELWAKGSYGSTAH